MHKNLLIVGAGIYGLVAKEIAQSIGDYDRIAFIDDNRETAADGSAVLGTFADMGKYAEQFSDVIVAIGNPYVRSRLLDLIVKEKIFEIPTLVSPRAYIAPSARIMGGTIVEPMAVVHSNCVIHTGGIISAGAVINHECVCYKCVHVDCNATVPGGALVPENTKIPCGTVYSGGWN